MVVEVQATAQGAMSTVRDAAANIDKVSGSRDVPQHGVSSYRTVNVPASALGFWKVTRVDSRPWFSTVITGQVDMNWDTTDPAGI
jgi:hypothetical protein